MKKSMRLNWNHTMTETNAIRHSGWKMIAICYGIYVLVTIFVLAFAQSLWGAKSIGMVLVADLIAAVLCVSFMRTVGKRSFSSLGMTNAIAKNYTLGWLIAMVIMTAIWLVNLFFGAITFSANKDFQLCIFLLLLIGFIFQGFLEEFLFRSLVWTQLSLKFGVIIATVITSCLFSLGHVSNSNASTLSVANTFLLSVLFCVMYYYHDNIWVVGAFHSGWNFVMGPLLGVEVSGFEQPTVLLKSLAKGDFAFLNGGLYGFEGGSLVTAATGVMIAIYCLLIRHKFSIKEKGKTGV